MDRWFCRWDRTAAANSKNRMIPIPQHRKYRSGRIVIIGSVAASKIQSLLSKRIWCIR